MIHSLITGVRIRQELSGKLSSLSGQSLVHAARDAEILSRRQAYDSRNLPAARHRPQSRSVELRRLIDRGQIEVLPPVCGGAVAAAG